MHKEMIEKRILVEKRKREDGDDRYEIKRRKRS